MQFANAMCATNVQLQLAENPITIGLTVREICPFQCCSKQQNTKEIECYYQKSKLASSDSFCLITSHSSSLIAEQNNIQIIACQNSVLMINKLLVACSMQVKNEVISEPLKLPTKTWHKFSYQRIKSQQKVQYYSSLNFNLNSIPISIVTILLSWVVISWKCNVTQGG